MLAGELEDVDGAQHAGLGRLDRIGLVSGRRGRAGEVVDLIEFAGKLHRLGDIALDQRKPVGLHQMLNIGGRTRRHVVDTGHMVAFAHQPLTQIGADETGAPQHQLIADARKGSGSEGPGNSGKLAAIKHGDTSVRHCSILVQSMIDQ